MRFDFSDLWHGFWKVLRNRSYSPPRPDYLTRTIVLIVPVAVLVLMILTVGVIHSPGTLLAGVAILAGGFLTSFTHLSTLRLRLSERASEHESAEGPERDLVDEVATLLLVATVVAVATATALVVGMTTGNGTDIRGVGAAIVAASASELLLLFLLTVPRMYNAYLQLNKVRRELNGADRRGEKSEGR